MWRPLLDLGCDTGSLSRGSDHFRAPQNHSYEDDVFIVKILERMIGIIINTFKER